MSEIKVDKINNLAGTGAANFTYGIKVGGVAQSIGAGTFTNSDTEPTSPSDGDVWYQPTLMYLDYRAGGEWKRVVGSGTANPTPYFGDRMLVGGGNLVNSPYKTNAIRYIDITGSGGSTSFGSLTANRTSPSGAAGGTRGLFIGGVENTYVNKIEYVTTTGPGNAQSFGSLVGSYSNPATASNGITAITAMGSNQSSIEKITIATTGNASSWSSSLTNGRNGGPGASDGTKGFFIGGYLGSTSNVIDYVTIATDANATDWGDLITARNGTGGNAACGTSTRILVGGGYNSSSQNISSIEYWSPVNAGNAYSFGNLTQVVGWTTSACNETKAVWATGYNGSRTTLQNIVTIDTAANATTFGSYAFNTDSGGSLSGAAS